MGGRAPPAPRFSRPLMTKLGPPPGLVGWGSRSWAPGGGKRGRGGPNAPKRLLARGGPRAPLFSPRPRGLYAMDLSTFSRPL